MRNVLHFVTIFYSCVAGAPTRMKKKSLKIREVLEVHISEHNKPMVKYITVRSTSL